MSFSTLTRQEKRAEKRELQGKGPRRVPTGTTLAVLVVIVFVLGAGYLAFSLLTDRNEPAGAVAPAAPPASSGSSGPSLFTQGFDVAGVIPGDVTWSLVSGVATPSSSSAGPLLRSDEGVSYGFNRTPAGATMATAVFAAQLNTHGTNRPALVTQRMDDVPGKDYLIQAYTGFRDDQLPKAPQWQLSAVRMLAYSPDVAQVEIVLARTSTSTDPDASALLSVVYLLAWSDNDWKVVPPADGAGQPLYPINSLDGGYVKFSGVG